MPSRARRFSELSEDETNSDVSLPFSELFKRVKDSVPALKRRKTGLNARFDRLVETMNVASSARKRTSTRSSSSSSDINSVPYHSTLDSLIDPSCSALQGGRVGESFSVLKMNGDGGDYNEAKKDTHLLPDWLSQVFSTLARNNPLRLLMSNVETDRAPSLPNTDLSDNTFAFSVPLSPDISRQDAFANNSNALSLNDSHSLLGLASPLPSTFPLLSTSTHLEPNCSAYALPTHNPFSPRPESSSTRTLSTIRRPFPLFLSDICDDALDMKECDLSSLVTDPTATCGYPLASPFVPAESIGGDKLDPALPIKQLVDESSHHAGYLERLPRNQSIGPVPEDQADYFSGIFKTPGPKYAPIYFDSPTEDPSSDKPVTPFTPDLDKPDFRWEPFRFVPPEKTIEIGLEAELHDYGLSEQRTSALPIHHSQHKSIKEPCPPDVENDPEANSYEHSAGEWDSRDHYSSTPEQTTFGRNDSGGLLDSTYVTSPVSKFPLHVSSFQCTTPTKSQHENVNEQDSYPGQITVSPVAFAPAPGIYISPLREPSEPDSEINLTNIMQKLDEAAATRSNSGDVTAPTDSQDTIESWGSDTA